MRKIIPPIERFWKKVTKAENGCWIWAGASLSYDAGYLYGQIYVNGKLKLAHVFAYETFVGPVPEGLELDHLCRTPACCNPEHVEPVTHRVNMLRGNTVAAMHAAQTHCVNGHEFNDKNTYRPKRGGRMCRVCSRNRNASRIARMTPDEFEAFRKRQIEHNRNYRGRKKL